MSIMVFCIRSCSYLVTYLMMVDLTKGKHAHMFKNGKMMFSNVISVFVSKYKNIYEHFYNMLISHCWYKVWNINIAKRTDVKLRP